MMYDIQYYIGVVSVSPGKAGGMGMSCLKCGKKTTEEQCFCKHCLEVMEQYPVKPDVHIQLPNRPETNGKKSSRKRRVISYEEATILWRKRARKLAVVVLVLTLLLGVAVALLVTGHSIR